MTWFTRNNDRVNPDDLSRQAEESLRVTRGQQEKVNVLTKWLDNRYRQNGFGDDFEYTLQPRGTK